MMALVLGLVSSSAFAADFTCEGKAQDQNGDVQHAEITVSIDDSSLSVQENNGTQFGLALAATYDENYRPSAKYAGYYRFNVKGNDGGWVNVLIQKPMLDNKRARGGAVVFQGTEEDGGTAAYFDYCTRK